MFSIQYQTAGCLFGFVREKVPKRTGATRLWKSKTGSFVMCRAGREVLMRSAPFKKIHFFFRPEFWAFVPAAAASGPGRRGGAAPNVWVWCCMHWACQVFCVFFWFGLNQCMGCGPVGCGFSAVFKFPSPCNWRPLLPCLRVKSQGGGLKRMGPGCIGQGSGHGFGSVLGAVFSSVSKTKNCKFW